MSTSRVNSVAGIPFVGVLSLVLLLSLFVIPLHAEETDNDKKENCERVDREGNCQYFKEIKVRGMDKLEFGGAIIEKSRTTKITINPATGNKKVTGGVSLNSEEYGPAKFEIKGEPDQAFIVTIPRTLTLAGQGGREFYVSDFIIHIPSNKSQNANEKQGNNRTRTGYFNRQGKAHVFVGGTLEVNPGGKGGTYVESLILDVEYRD